MVRTRFAPSPTGYLHIGGVRTALYNWLFARQHGGQFILRIDDTDRQRNVQQSLRPILDGLRWLGIEWDEGPEVGGPLGPYYQSQRLDRYRNAVEKLLAGGHAYYDYATTEEIQAERAAAEREKRMFRYSRRFMAETPADRARFEAEGRQAVVRLKIPAEGKLTIDDAIRGRVEFDWANEQDHVVQRADGTCLYHLANVVDDHDFQITHVIRAEEHLSNTPRQVFIVEALGYPRPAYAHLPLVAEPGSHTKLSKRKLDKYLKNRDFAELFEHGRKIAALIGHPVEADAFNPVIVDFYQTVGFLPEAIVNYLALLGWALDDKTEHFSRKELIESFSLDRVNKAPASFDPRKLMAFEERHFQQLPQEEKVSMVLPYLQKAGFLSDTLTVADRAKVAAIVKAAGDRIKIAGDILSFSEFFMTKPPIDPVAKKKAIHKPTEDIELLKNWCQVIPTIQPFEAATYEKRLHEFASTEERRFGDIVRLLRVALTGKSIGLGLYETAEILGYSANTTNIQLFIFDLAQKPEDNLPRSEDD
ncbi:MAG: glutamate--tRNA ligase [Planctomycetes bacterium]|nr:glutamate--tRNA ligase [Planctomycetota bacterium]MBU4398351.1 glutamate--tRNA ligase [Planctomycetota bacterium]MCG2683635.1 glutamate--tRNA ligase [Planctomycetales bacterium]